ncbi:MAG TPA: hypothetical protein DHW14_03910 [Clostridiales bacterium]|nr:hypothetical protein [Clostridiales bacterium]
MGEGGKGMAPGPVPRTTKLVEASGLDGWLRAVAREARVWAPVRVDGRPPLFREFRTGEGDRLDLEAVRTVNSPKGALLPQTEPLMTYAMTKDAESGRPSLDLERAAPGGPVVVFGARPCDAAAFELLDKVFLTGDFVDDHYQARRVKTTVVAVACPRPDEACFCTSFGLSPGGTRGADVVLYGRNGPGVPVETDAYYAVAYTERGEAFLAAPAARAAGVADVPEDEGRRLEEVVSAFRGLGTPLGDRLGRIDVAARLDGLFDHPYWEKVSARCLSCGACTFICPTCYCFGVADCGALGKGVRYRYWDACKLPHFMLMAGGHNPRPAKSNRTRQRFMHKLNYYHHRYGEYQCVGCGRCVESCPVGLHLPLVAGEVRGLEG